MTATTTTGVGNDILFSFGRNGGTCNISGFGAGETQVFSYNDHPNHGYVAGAWKAAAATPGSESMTINSTGSCNIDAAMAAIKAVQPTVTATSTIYRAKVDDGSFNSYSFADNTWTVYDKHGTRYTYGSDDTGRMYDTTTGTSINTYRWYLQEVRDTNDNYVKYTYTRDNNVLYPNVITYTGHGSTDGFSTVTFATSTRTDTRVSYASGFAATTNKVISEIDAAVNGTTVRKYLLGYGVGDNGYRSLLTSVQQQGYDDNGNLTTLPPTTFTYATSSAQFYAPGATRIANAAFVVADSNGNGTNDVNAFVTSPYDGTIHWNIYYDNTGNMTSLSNPNFLLGNTSTRWICGRYGAFSCKNVAM